jgi:hypothetical protein
MLHIVYCPPKREEVTTEGYCEECKYYFLFKDFFEHEWMECTFEFWDKINQDEYLEIVERLQIGL